MIYDTHNECSPHLTFQSACWVIGMTGKSALVLFCCALWCVQYEDFGHSNTSFELSLPLCDCLCKPHVLTYVAITSLSSS